MPRQNRLVGRYRSWLYPLLESFDPERAHHLALQALRVSGSLPDSLALLRPEDDARLAVELFGLRFTNPLGVAAGFDKNAEAVPGLFKLGFGAVEVGTVTPLAQPGNAPPRLWRFPEEGALINALGFPSQGSASMRQHLVTQGHDGVIGINLGKNRSTPAEQAAADYAAVLETLWDVADYVTINVSSPNTPGLRDLQRRDALGAIIRAVDEQNRSSAHLHRGTPRPLLVKIAPDLDDAALDDVLAGITDGDANGIIVANTSIDHSLLGRDVTHLPGGLSGRPIRALATTMLRKVYRLVGASLPIVGVGGIESAGDVIERMRAGASLVQLYTAFIYGGPALPGAILRGLSDYAEREGVKSITEIVGVDAAG